MIRKAVRSIMPVSIRHKILNCKEILRHALEARKNRHKTTAEIFSEIYEKNKWGGKPGEISSGPGSSGATADIYVENINKFIESNHVKTVLDIGCGDFCISGRLICEDYTGVDVVQEVINRNNAKFATKARRFICMDVTKADNLPTANLCLVRQVLQHLSNEQIISILNKLVKFKFVIITEHYPADSEFRLFNKNKVQGRGTRLYYGSGVYLDKPPFNVKVEFLFECPGIKDADEVHQRGPIRSFLVRNTT